jgi:hypothetical protein
MDLKIVKLKNSRERVISISILALACALSLLIISFSYSEIFSKNGIVRIVNYSHIQNEEVKGAVTQKRTSELTLEKNLAFNDTPSLGLESSAKVVLIEFIDVTDRYSSSYFLNTRNELIDEFVKSGDLIILTKQYPLVINQGSTEVAIALQCAFLENGEVNFELQIEDVFRGDYQFDQKYIEKCSADQSIIFSLNNNLEIAQQFNLDSVPAFLVGKLNGEKIEDIEIINGAEGFIRFSKLIREKSNG